MTALATDGDDHCLRVPTHSAAAEVDTAALGDVDDRARLARDFVEELAPIG